jgi:DNA-binding CsgD family transcriptional regulator
LPEMAFGFKKSSSLIVLGFLHRQGRRGIRSPSYSRILGVTHLVSGDVPWGFQGEFTMAKELTPRQKQVVRLLSLGCTVREVAKILKLSPSTVDNHKSAAMARLGTDKVALLTRWAIKLGISPLNDRLSEREKRLSGRKNDGWND